MSWRTDAEISESAPEATVHEAELVAFVRQHHARLIRLAALVCRHPLDAEDAVQAGFEQAWRRRSTLREQALLKPWLDRIVVREAIRVERRNMPLPFRSPLREIEVEPIDKSAQPATVAAARADLEKAFVALPTGQRAVVALHLYSGYTIAETAKIVGIPVETARSRLRVARDRLRFHLEEGVR